MLLHVEMAVGLYLIGVNINVGCEDYSQVLKQFEGQHEDGQQYLCALLKQETWTHD